MAFPSLTPAQRLRLYRNELIRQRLALLALQPLGFVIWLLGLRCARPKSR